MPAIFLVDDHPVIRESYALLVEFEPDLTLCGEAASGAQALAEIPQARPDLVLVDVQLGDMSGIALVEMLVTRDPGLAVIVVSGHSNREMEARALAAGARAYLPKQEVPDHLADLIRTVLGSASTA